MMLLQTESMKMPLSIDEETIQMKEREDKIGLNTTEVVQQTRTNAIRMKSDRNGELNHQGRTGEIEVDRDMNGQIIDHLNIALAVAVEVVVGIETVVEAHCLGDKFVFYKGEAVFVCSYVK